MQQHRIIYDVDTDHQEKKLSIRQSEAIEMAKGCWCLCPRDLGLTQRRHPYHQS